MSRIRVVVADQAEAIFYDLSSLKARPVEVARLRDPLARRAIREIPLDDEPDLRRKQLVSFARTIAERLESDRLDRAFQQLILVAGAPFRSVLRTELSASSKACIVYEVPKDLVHSHLEVLRDYLPDRAQELRSA